MAALQEGADLVEIKAGCTAWPRGRVPGRARDAASAEPQSLGHARSAMVHALANARGLTVGAWIGVKTSVTHWVEHYGVA